MPPNECKLKPLRASPSLPAAFLCTGYETSRTSQGLSALPLTSLMIAIIIIFIIMFIIVDIPLLLLLLLFLSELLRVSW